MVNRKAARKRLELLRVLGIEEFRAEATARAYGEAALFQADESVGAAGRFLGV